MSIAVITTFPSNMYQVYAKDMIESFVKYWPAEIPLLVQLDDDLVLSEVQKILRPQDACAVGWTKEHLEFVQRNKAQDHPTDYRKQTTRFCHKVFALHRALTAARAEKEKPPRYLIWLDADTITTRPVAIEEIEQCLPKEAAVSYMGRVDWPHSECGFLAFDLQKEGDIWIDVWHGMYIADEVLKLSETHDSWVFDHIRKSKDAPKAMNLTEGKPGMDIWPHSPMGKWSVHKKGPVAKGIPVQPMRTPGSNVIIQTRNAIPNEEIRSHIAENQILIKNWITECIPNNEEIVIVSAGPQLMAEDVLEDYNKGKKIVAVKHAMDRLKAADIQPWACILLDPRPHVYDFVKDPDPNVLWFVASQVNPKVTMKLLAHGCKVWGYHASVGADEGPLTSLQPHSVISGGSATATRGWFVLKHLGFTKFKLFGYDLCFPDKVDLNARDELGQPKYLEMSIGWNDPLSNVKKCFWSEPQLIAQFEEINQLIQSGPFELEAVGEGIVPFILKAKKGGELRRKKLQAKMSKPVSYERLLCNKTKKSLMQRLRLLSKNRLKMTPAPR